MNKKFKLFSTIASLCLAVALMAFGVWAASTTATLNVGGSVSFKATGVEGSWRYKITSDDADGTSTGLKTEFTSTDADVTNAAIAIADGKNEVTFVVTAEFTVTSESATGTLVASGDDKDETNYKVTYTKGNDGSWSSDSKIATTTITVKVEIKDAAQNNNATIAWNTLFIATAGNASA